MDCKLTTDLERLYGENPIVARENGRTEESVHPRMTSMVADSCKGSSLENGKVMMNELQQSTGQFRMGESNRAIRDHRSLTSAVEKLSLGAERSGRTWLKNDQFENYMNKQSFISEAPVVADPSLRSSHHLNNGYYDIHMKVHSPQISISPRPVSDGLKNGEACHLQPFETPSPVMPSTHEMPAMPFPISSHLEKMLPSGLSPMHFMHPQQMNHGQMGLNCTKEELVNSCMMQGQHQYLHDLHNQQQEYSNQFESFGNATFGKLRFLRSPKKKCCFEYPVSHNLEQSKHDGFSNGTANYVGSGISNHVFSTPYVDTLDGQDKSFKQCSPRKIPIMTHGLNVVDCMKVPSVDAEKQKYFMRLNSYLCQSCYFRQFGFPSTATDCVCHENLRVSAMLSSYAKHKTEIPPLQCNSLDEATGKIYLMAKDQHGCRFLQRMFSEGTKEDIDMIFNEIIQHVSELMIDPFGNYLIQKLLGVCDEDQRLQILYQVNRPGELIRISCNMHGTRAVQKLIETLKTPEQFSMIVSLLKPGIVILMKNINGNHVAQHCLQFLVSEYIEFLFDAATKCCAEVATDRHGCCVLQKCLSCSDHRQRDRLLTAVVCNALFLSQDQYGNYVVQFAFDLARNPTAIPWVISGILKRLEGHFADLSIQKYSSNVVEKCASIGEEYLTKIIDELINDERFSQIMLNPYGNYAVQAVLAHSGICKGSSLHANLVAAIRPHVPLLRTNMYGKKVLGMLGKVN
ncbi:pumilio homolog 12-like isoform X1 [Cucurbita maxima]|uniref:Pumilio homolog 12-like isoform X1 n=1 Tax=Cucurbita maxima TaxID=3661 RepID=A0A6J1HUY8_CUCMA|nr:pumilio homolog 12-like isoform X1 [Cucurbita maxima]